MTPINVPVIAILDKDGILTDITYSEFVRKLFKDRGSVQANLDHAAMGVSGESAELLEGVLNTFDVIKAIQCLIISSGNLTDFVKKYTCYNKELNMKNIVEEIGDARFYLQAIMNLLSISENTVLQTNANKLCERYQKLEYSDAAAIARADKKGE